MGPALVPGSLGGPSAGPAAAAAQAQVGVQRKAGGPCICVTAPVVPNKPSLHQP